jgi:hypothetical protein
MFVSVYCLNKCTIKIKNQVFLLIISTENHNISLFADDTSIGHTAHDENTLKNMINIDLKYIQIWSKRWLVKFNPSKTDIMIMRGMSN